MAKNTVIVSVLGDTRDLKQKLDGAGGSFGGFAKAAAAGAAIVAAAAGTIAVKAVKSASELEQNLGAMGSVFKSNGAQMEKWATTAASTVGLAKSEYSGLATVLGSQMKNMGISANELSTKTNDLIGLGADLAAQFGGSTSDAVSALSSLLRGERDPIERYGVSINEAAVKAKMAEMGLAGLTGEAEKNARLSATLALLYDQTADAQGAFARESTTLAGAQQRLAAGTENLYATLGTSLLPAVTAVTAAIGGMVNKLAESAGFQAFTKRLTEASNAFADFVYGLLNGTSSIDFGSLLSGLLPAIVNGIHIAANWLASGGLQPIIQSIINGRTAMLDGAVQLFTALADALPVIVPALMEAVLLFVQQIVELLGTSGIAFLEAGVLLFTSLIESLAIVTPQIIVALLEMLPQLVETLLTMVPAILDAATQVFNALVAAVPVIVPPLVTALIEILPQLVATIIGMLPAILNAAIQLFTAIVQSLPIVLPAIVGGIIDLLPTLISTIISLVPALLSAAVELFLAIAQAVPRIIPQMLSAIANLGSRMVGAISGLVGRMVSAGADLIGGLVQGLWNAAGAVGSAILDIGKSAVDGFLGFFGIKSPSRLFMKFGKFIDEGLALGITKNSDLVADAMTGLSKKATATFTPKVSAGEIDAAFDGHHSRSAQNTGGNTYNVELQTLNANAETGRVIVEAIRDYEDEGGRQ